MGLTSHISLVLTVICILIFTTLVTSSTEQRSLRRDIRSPQLFPSRNLLTDLTQLKPPSLNDLNEFRQKMASLANLTALLEQAVAAEKNARNTLQGFVNKIKDQIVGVQKAVNPDPENYWTESKTCGGILVSQTGRITYKLNDYYHNHERCTWTIRANRRSKIKVTFSAGDLEKTHDFIAVTELVNNNSINGNEWSTKRLLPDHTALFDGPLIFITFVADGSITRKGIQIEFEGMGSYINANTIYQHFHFSNWSGHFDSSNLSESLQGKGVKIEEGTQLLATVVVNPSNWNVSNLLFTVAEETLDLRPDDCKKTNLAFSSEFPILSHGILNKCCGRKCEVGNFQSANGIMMGMLKSSDITEGSHFHLNWSTDTSIRQVESVDKCGGVLSGNIGRIQYRKETSYDKNERCLWIIQADILTERKIKIQLVKDGFEKHYDFLSLTFLTDDKNGPRLETQFLYESSTPVLILSPVVFVEFYSDDDNIGKSTGFELIWEVMQTSSNVLGLDVEYMTEDNGSKHLSCSADNEENNTAEILVINSNKEGTKQRLLTLEMETAAISNELSIFVSERGNFTKANGSLNEHQSNDGIIAILRKCSSPGGDATITWKTEEISVPGESSNGQLFVKSDDKCGDVLFGDSGRITYKLGREYELNERCTWIIRSKNLSAISVQLMVDGFESCCDGIKINKINVNDGVIDPEQISISRENRFHTQEASVLMVTFSSDHSVKGTGFVLEFHTKGEPITSANDYVVNHSHTYLESRPTLGNPFGPISIQLLDNLLHIATFAFQHVEIATANMSVEVKLDNLQLNECNQDSVSLYHMPIGEYTMLKKLPSKELCAIERSIEEVPISDAVLTSEQENIHIQPKGVLIAVAKIKAAKPDKNLSFKFE